MFAEPITRSHHIWNKEAAEADELLLLSLRGLPFGGGSYERGDDLNQSPRVSSSQMGGMGCVGSSGRRGRRQPGPSGSALSLAGGMKVLGLCQQGQKHKTNQASPSTDSALVMLQVSTSVGKSTPTTDVVTSPEENTPASAPLPPPCPGSSWNIQWMFHPVKCPPSALPLLIAQTWLLMSPLVFTELFIWSRVSSWIIFQHKQDWCTQGHTWQSSFLSPICTMTTLKIQVKNVIHVRERTQPCHGCTKEHWFRLFESEICPTCPAFHHMKIDTNQPKETHLSHIHFWEGLVHFCCSPAVQQP